MSYTDRHIIETYMGLFEGLSALNKIELIESLTKSLKMSAQSKEERFYASFGAFGSDETPQDLIADLKAHRQFQEKEIQF